MSLLHWPPQQPGISLMLSPWTPPNEPSMQQVSGRSGTSLATCNGSAVSLR